LSPNGVDVAQHPKFGDLTARYREKSGPRPNNLPACRWNAHKRRTMDAAKSHARRYTTLCPNQIVYNASIIAKSGMDCPHVADEAFMADPFVTERTTKPKAGVQDLPRHSFVCLIPDFPIKPLNQCHLHIVDKFRCQFHRVCAR
jgi:hypothetical protein